MIHRQQHTATYLQCKHAPAELVPMLHQDDLQVVLKLQHESNLSQANLTQLTKLHPPSYKQQLEPTLLLAQPAKSTQLSM